MTRGNGVVFGKYLSQMKLRQWQEYTWDDTERLKREVEEKAKFLKQCVDNDYLLFFEHDAHHELASLKMTEKGVRLDETLGFNEVFGY